MEHKETIGYANTIDEIKKIAKVRYENTDGYDTPRMKHIVKCSFSD